MRTKTTPAPEPSAAVLESVRRHGIVNPLLVVRDTDRVWVGNQRLVAARRLGIRRVPVVRVWTKEDVRAELARYSDAW